MAGRPPKADALTPAQRAKRYRDAKKAAACVTEIQPSVTKTATLDDWPFPGTEGWFRKYGFVVAYPRDCLA